jgi:dTDP-glucose 4,6-dehydratase
MVEFTPERVLTTGGAGFIGANFVRYLLGQLPRVRVVTLDLLTYAGSLKSLADLPGADRHTFVKGDICDEALVRTLLREHRIDTIVHFAAESHVDRSIEGPAAFVRTNVIGTFTLLEAARSRWLDEERRGPGACRFHHISTDEVYGSLRRGEPPFTEALPYAPSSPYSASKASSDHLVRAYNHTYGLPTTQTNCSNNYGPYQHGEKFIPTVIRACREGRPIPVYGDGSNLRDWLFVTDHCAGVLSVIQRGRVGECYNLGGENERANIDIARLICCVFDELRPAGAPHERLITFVKDRPGHDFRYAIDPRKVREEIGWTPSETFEVGIRETIQWYLRD